MKSGESGASRTRPIQDATEARPGALYPRVGKRLLDVAVVLALAPVWFPLYLGIALVLLVLQGPPIHFRTVRMGADGREFSIVKFRTMRRDALPQLQALLASDPELHREFRRSAKLRSDPRITRLGALLRRSSLDELPQLWNVVWGEMSLVGPRPVSRTEWEHFYGDLAQDVFSFRPGLTGLWQVSGRSLLPYQRRVALDLSYVNGCHLTTDLSILVKTVPSVLRGHGAF